MKHVNLVLLLSIWAFSFANSMEFVGYDQQKNPILFDNKSKQVYSIKNDTVVEMYKIPRNGELVAVHGEYSVIEKNKSFVLLADNSPLDTFNFDPYPYSLFIDDEGGIFYTDRKTTEIRSTKPTFKDKIDGELVGIFEDHLFYLVANEKVIHPDATLVKYNMKSKKRELITKNLAEDANLLIPDSGLLFSQKLKDGGFKPLVVDFKTKKEVFLPAESRAKYEESNILYFDYSDGAFKVVHQETKKIETIFKTL